MVAQMSRAELGARLIIALGLLVLWQVLTPATGTGVIFNDVVLQDGATDGSEGYFLIGNDIVISVNPTSHEFTLLHPLKGKRVEFRIVPR